MLFNDVIRQDGLVIDCWLQLLDVIVKRIDFASLADTHSKHFGTFACEAVHIHSLAQE